MVESNSGPGDKPAPGEKPGTAAKPGAGGDEASDALFAASRKAPPNVPPVSLNGVRYEQVMSGAELGETGRTGYLAAYDEATGERLWHLQVYAHERIDYLEQDVQDVFFASMTPMEDGKRLLIENERGERFEVDVEVRKVVSLPAE